MEYLALAARFHLFVPALLYFTLADSPVDKPAKMPTLKFPCRAISLDLHGTPSYHPTRLVPLVMGVLHGQKEEHLPLNMNGDVPPSLFEALDGLERSTQ